VEAIKLIRIEEYYEKQQHLKEIHFRVSLTQGSFSYWFVTSRCFNFIIHLTRERDPLLPNFTVSDKNNNIDALKMSMFGLESRSTKLLCKLTKAKTGKNNQKICRSTNKVDLDRRI